MANYNSILDRFNKPKSRINHKYIDATLKDKQNTIDTNFGLIQQQVESVLGQDFANPEDAEMLKGKVSDVLNNLQNTDSIKFDSKKARFVMQDALNEAAKDPEVLKQISNTKKIRAFQASVEEAKKKGTYSENNYQAAAYQAGLSSYMKSGEERSTELGDLNYSPYYDDQKEISESIANINKNYNQEIEEVRLDYTTTPPREITTKRRPMTAEAVENMARRNLSDKAKYQMAIDGAAKFGFSQEGANSFIVDILDNTEKTKKEVLSKVEAELSIDGISDNRKEALNSRKNQLEGYYNDRINEYTQLQGKSPMAVGRAYQEGYLMSNFLPKNYGSERVTKSKIDEAYYKDKAAKLALAEFNSKDAKRKFDMHQKMIETGQAAGQGDVQVLDGTILPSGEKATVDEAYDDVNEHKAKAISAGNKIKNLFPEKYKVALAQIEAKNLEDGIDTSKRDPVELQNQVIRKLKSEGRFDAKDNQAIGDYEKTYVDAHSRIEDFNQNYNEAEQEVINDNYQNLYENLTPKRERINRRTGEKITTGDVRIINKSGDPESVSNIFKANNITDGESFKEFLEKPESNTIKANFLLMDEFNNNTRGGSSQKNDKFKKREEAQRLLGLNDVEMEDYLKKYRSYHSQIAVSYSDMTSLGGVAKKLSNRDSADPDKLRETRIRQYKNKGVNEKSSNVISINGGTQAANSFKAFPNLGINIKNEEQIFITENKANSNKMDVYATEEVVNESEAGESKKTYKKVKKGTINKKDITDRSLLSQVNIMEENKRFDFNITTKAISSEPRYFEKDTDDIRSTFIDTLFEGNTTREAIAQSELTTKVGVESYLDNTMKVLGTSSNYQEANNLKDFYLKNFSDFRIQYGGNKNIGTKIKVVYKVPTKDKSNEFIEIASFDLDRRVANSKEYNQKMSSYPNVILAQEMRRVLVNSASRNSKGLNKENIQKILH